MHWRKRIDNKKDEEFAFIDYFNELDRSDYKQSMEIFESHWNKWIYLKGNYDGK